MVASPGRCLSPRLLLLLKFTVTQTRQAWTPECEQLALGPLGHPLCLWWTCFLTLDQSCIFLGHYGLCGFVPSPKKTICST